MARNNQRGRNNNNPEGRNQYSSNGWMDTARDKPFTTAAAAAAAVGAGVFLWSRRNQISDQISNLSGQLYDWADEMRSGNSDREMAIAGGLEESGTIESSRSSASRRTTSAKARTGKSGAASRSNGRGMSETGGGNASIGAHGGTTGTGARA